MQFGAETALFVGRRQGFAKQLPADGAGAIWRQHSATVAQLNWSKLWHVDTYLKKARCGLATRDMCVPSTLTPSVGMALEVQAALVPHHAQAVSAACARCGRLVALRALALAALLRPGQGVTS